MGVCKNVRQNKYGWMDGWMDGARSVLNKHVCVRGAHRPLLGRSPRSRPGERPCSRISYYSYPGAARGGGVRVLLRAPGSCPRLRRGGWLEDAKTPLRFGSGVFASYVREGVLPHGEAVLDQAQLLHQCTLGAHVFTCSFAGVEIGQNSVCRFFHCIELFCLALRLGNNASA